MAYQVTNPNSTIIRWHVFYVGVDGFIRQKSNSNVTNVWVDGNINAQNLAVNQTEQLALQACWDGDFYSDSDSPHPFPVINNTNHDSGKGLQLYFAGTSSGVQQYVTTEGLDKWELAKSWTAFTGRSGVTCTCSVEETPVAYTMGINLQDHVEVWWKDTNASNAITQSHPINVWADGKH